jgi:serine/threonine protein kinase
MSALKSGYLLWSRYSIQRVLGQGGFGITYLAYDVERKSEVCIKEHFLRWAHRRGWDGVEVEATEQLPELEGWLNLFFKEAQRLAKYNQKNIVRIRDVFRSNGTAYIVMDYVEGLNVKQWVRQHGPFSEHVALQLFADLLDAVETIHHSGHLHRDIKPENVLMSQEGGIVLIDFGSGCDTRVGSLQPPRATVSPGYAPPEQYKAIEKQGRFTDIYALGATLYFMLTGERPEPSKSRSESSGVLSPPRSLNPSLSSGTSAAVMRAMQMQPKNRYQSVHEFRADLRLNPMCRSEPIDFPWLSRVRAQASRLFRKYKFEWTGMLVLAAIVALLCFIAEAFNIGEENPTGQPSLEEVAAQHVFDCGVDRVEFDGHAYRTIEINGRCWFGENLRTVHFANGDEIQGNLNDLQWSSTSQASQCLYKDRWTLLTRFGRLYNGYAVQDRRNLCPSGWHVSTAEDWATISFASTSQSSTFTQNLGGIRDEQGSFGHLNSKGYWWTSWFYATAGKGKSISFDDQLPSTNLYDMHFGLAVRCVRDDFR